MGREKKAKRARKEALLASITDREVMTVAYWDIVDAKRKAKGKAPKVRKLTRAQKKRVKVARKLWFSAVAIPEILRGVEAARAALLRPR